MNVEVITKEEIRSIPSLHRQMVDDVERLHYLESKASSVPSALSGSGERIQETVKNRSGIYAEEAADLRQELTQRDAELKALKKKAAAFAKTAETKKAAKVIELRYVKVLTWPLIADLMNLTERRVHQIEAAEIARLA